MRFCTMLTDIYAGKVKDPPSCSGCSKSLLLHGIFRQEFLGCISDLICAPIIVSCWCFADWLSWNRLLFRHCFTLRGGFWTYIIQFDLHRRLGWLHFTWSLELAEELRCEGLFSWICEEYRPFRWRLLCGSCCTFELFTWCRYVWERWVKIVLSCKKK